MNPSIFLIISMLNEKIKLAEENITHWYNQSISPFDHNKREALDALQKAEEEKVKYITAKKNLELVWNTYKKVINGLDALKTLSKTTILNMGDDHDK